MQNNIKNSVPGVQNSVQLISPFSPFDIPPIEAFNFGFNSDLYFSLSSFNENNLINEEFALLMTSESEENEVIYKYLEETEKYLKHNK